MTCQRCKGLMVRIHLDDERTRVSLDAMTCLVCGDLVDEVILENRKRSILGQAQKSRRRSVRHTKVFRTKRPAAA
jgi:hypothetical protein